MVESDKYSAILTVEFDWSEDGRTGKITREQEAFLYDTRRLAQGGGDEDTYPYKVIDTKLRVRGAGRVMKVRYEADTGKDFILIGHSIYGITRTDSEGSK
jgi:hypothetical protein